MFPAASSTLTTTDGERATPAVALLGCVVNTSLVATKKLNGLAADAAALPAESVAVATTE